MIADRLEKRFREEDDVPKAVKRLKTEVGKASLSTLALPDQFQKITGPDHAICCDRPFETATIPLVLLYEAFGIFKDRCVQPPSKAALACLNELAPTACIWYEKETARRDAVLKVLRKHLHLTFHSEKVPSYVHGENLTVVVMPASIRGCKNEEDNPLNQAVLYYSNYLARAIDSPKNFYNFDTRFPCILLVDRGMSTPSSTAHLLMIYSGSYFAFYGALWDGDRVRVEPLTPGFDLARESKTRETIASSLDAFVLRLTISKLTTTKSKPRRM